jgi:hypothetical protein
MTLLEVLGALGILVLAMVMVAQLGVESLAERSRADRRSAALEFAANVLETARSRRWSELTPEWAASVRLPDELQERWIDPQLAVRVEPEPERPRVKRVTVHVRWTNRIGQDDRGVLLTALFADRIGGSTP